MEDVPAALRRLRALPDEELGRVCRAFDVRVLTVFGSALRDDDPQDLDIGVIFEPGAAHDVIGLRDALESLLGTEQIDLLDAGRASETARMRSIAEGEARWESEPTAYAAAAMAAEALFLETADMRRRALESVGTS